MEWAFLLEKTSLLLDKHFTQNEILLFFRCEVQKSVTLVLLEQGKFSHASFLKNAAKITLPSWLLLLHLFFTLKSVIYPDKRLLSTQKLSTK